MVAPLRSASSEKARAYALHALYQAGGDQRGLGQKTYISRLFLSRAKEVLKSCQIIVKSSCLCSKTLDQVSIILLLLSFSFNLALGFPSCHH